jgi:aldehyde dehydrogenase (NAD+)
MEWLTLILSPLFILISTFYFFWEKIFPENIDKHFIIATPSNDPSPNWKVLTKKEEPLLEDIPQLHKELRESFSSGFSLPIEFRLKQLKAIKKMFEENENELKEALKKDLGRPSFEATYYDILLPLGELDNLIHNLHNYTKPESTSFSLLTFPSVNKIYKEPYGLVLVLGTWNYPIMLTMVPVVGAIAAGNCVVLKPSNISPNSARLLGKLLPRYVDSRVLSVVGPSCEGDRTMTGALLKLKWDYIFFTGSPSIGKIVMQEAANFLTPVTLELGGKNPVIVCNDADIDLAAKRCVWGRMMNAGQQCIAPDFVLIEKNVVDKFLERSKHWVKELYGENPKENGNFGRIVGQKQMERIIGLLKTHGGEVVCGGSYQKDCCYIEPTVVKVDSYSSSIMQEETFGPILIVKPIDSVSEAISFINSKPKPLSMYIFSSNVETQEKIIYNTSAGGVTVNATLFHVAHPGMPFGGIGESGTGTYHGKHTFDTFSHRKPVLKKSVWKFDGGLLSDPFFVYPPWNETKEKIVKLLMKFV